ncbi:MAG: LPS export ABC transporter periplasmic protein LptC [Gemmatimonadales bacterium]|nr:LPS export ABC transporter periplasmic protein LptC [Candidatus Palauibacter irciniicola]MYC18244.1 LPS export ABC transporter periplasmic protein LptC [Gemmatimonadales bacterium]
MRVENGERTGRPGALGLFAWVSVLPILAACGSDDGPPTASEPLPDGVDTAVRGMRTFVTRDGVRRALVEADTAEWRAENEIHLRRMTLTFFDPNGRESTDVTAEFGIFYQLTGDLDAEGNVVVEDRVDGQRLETERLGYQNLDGRLTGDTAFRLLNRMEGLTLAGTGFESDPALDSVIVLNQEGEMQPGMALSESVPLPAVPAGETTEGGAEPAAGEPVAGEPAPGDSMAAELDPRAEIDPARGEVDPAAEIDPEAVPPDIAEMPADTAAAAPPDSVTAPPDTTAAVTPPDSAEAPPDTTAAVTPPDSVEAPPDTTATVAPPDSLGAPPDTTATARR